MFPRPDTIYLHVTKACNLQCVYCYLGAGKPVEKGISLEEMTDLFQDFIHLRPRKIVFTGGEPLIRHDFFDLIHALNDADQDHHIQRCMNTNGTLISQEIAKELVNLFDDIRISIDGLQEVHDSLRGEGTFEKAVKAIDYVQMAGGNPTISVTVNSRNIGEIRNLLTFLLGEKRVCNIHLSQFKTYGRGLHRKDLLCSRKQLVKVTAEFWEEYFGIQVEPQRNNGDGEPIDNAPINCGVGKYINIYPDGSVYPCHLLSYPEFCIGNIKDDNLTAIYHQSTLMAKLRRLNFQEIAQCAECFRELAEDDACLGTVYQEHSSKNPLVDLLNEEENQSNFRENAFQKDIL